MVVETALKHGTDYSREEIPAQINPLERIRSDIDLSSRISHLGLSPGEGSLGMSANNISQRLGASVDLVEYIAQGIGITPDGKNGLREYPPLTLELVSAEIKWLLKYLEASEFLGISGLANLVGKSDDWVRDELEQSLDDTTPFDDMSMKHHKSLAIDIRHRILSTPLDNGWMTAGRLEKITGRDYKWIGEQLLANGIKSQERWSSVTGKLYEHYPPESLDIIKTLIVTEEGSDWITANYIANAITARSDIWVRKRLSEKYANLAEPRLDDNGATRLHYPPTVLIELMSEIEHEESLPAAGDYITVDSIARALGHYATWVTNRLDVIGVIGETRMNDWNRIQTYYPPDTIQKLKDLPADVIKQPHIGWITARDVRNATGKTKEWVKNNLLDYQSQAVQKKSSNGRYYSYYPTEVLDNLITKAANNSRKAT